MQILKKKIALSAVSEIKHDTDYILRAWLRENIPTSRSAGRVSHLGFEASLTRRPEMSPFPSLIAVVENRERLVDYGLMAVYNNDLG